MWVLWPRPCFPGLPHPPCGHSRCQGVTEKAMMFQAWPALLRPSLGFSCLLRPPPAPLRLSWALLLSPHPGIELGPRSERAESQPLDHQGIPSKILTETKPSSFCTRFHFILFLRCCAHSSSSWSAEHWTEAKSSHLQKGFHPCLSHSFWNLPLLLSVSALLVFWVFSVCLGLFFGQTAWLAGS